mmetsp:Transcript_2094/g.3505  ORF Transcript_2094/g.3505 Transcript_2094/m.3505 type:complete len:205 (+) Transcript_2094:2-616(+)
MTRLGRYVACAAQFAPKRGSFFFALDAFAGTGLGSTSLLALGLQRRCGGRLVVFEEMERLAQIVIEALSKYSAYYVWGEALQPGVELPLLTIRNCAPQVIIIGGRALGGAGHLEYSPLRTLCRGVDLVMIDTPATSFAAEWAVLEQCEPQFVFIHNTNLPDHAGWIEARLRLRGYRILAEGAHGGGGHAQEFFKELSTLYETRT